jgi:hypothetical protein
MPRPTRPKAAKTRTTPRKAPESIDAALDRLQAALEEAGHPTYGTLVFEPVKKGELARAEKALGARLPPSYVDLITRRGVFHIGKRKGTRFNPLLSPAAIAQHTLDTRAAYAAEVPELAETLADLIFFQGNRYLDNFFAFVVSSKDEHGELGVTAFYHDDHDEISDAEGDFRSHIVELVDEWIDELEG